MKHQTPRLLLSSIIAAFSLPAFTAQAATIVSDALTSTTGWTIDNDVDSNGELLIFEFSPAFDIPATDLRVHRQNSGGNDNVGTMTQIFDTSGFSGVTLRLDLYQPANSSWEGDELFQIFVDNGSGYTSVYSDAAALDGVSVGSSLSITLDSTDIDMDDNASLGVRFWFNPGFWSGRSTTNTGGEEYVLQHFFLEGTAIPEPSAALLGGLGCLLFLRRRR